MGGIGPAAIGRVRHRAYIVNDPAVTLLRFTGMALVTASVLASVMAAVMVLGRQAFLRWRETQELDVKDAK